MATRTLDPVGLIIAYESGEISNRDALRLFSHLIRTGQAWTLQGHYGRTAAGLIDAGLIGPDGEILADDPDTDDACHCGHENCGAC